MSIKWKDKHIMPLPNAWETFDEDQFNNWLFENLSCIAKLINVDLQAVEREHRTPDQKRLDILAKYTDDENDEYVAIESQLTEADFSHFGRLIMYCASSEFQPKIAIWIVANSQESHLKSIEWMNNNTLTNYEFWLLSVNTVKVNNKAVGVEIIPIFKPDNERRILIQEKKIQEHKIMTETRHNYQNFWNVFSAIEEEVVSNQFGKTGRNDKGWARLSSKMGVWISNNRLLIHIYTDKYDIYKIWKNNEFAESLGSGWKYREGGQKKDVFFIEKIIIENWQEYPENWSKYSEEIIKEALRVVDILEKK